MSPDARPDAEAPEATPENPETDVVTPVTDEELELADVPSLEEQEEELLDELEDIEGLSAEEHEQFIELRDKKSKYDRAQELLGKLVANREEREKQLAYKEAPRRWVYVRHAGRSVATRAIRRARAGYRRQGVILDNGLRIRKKGRQRLTRVNLKEFVTNHEQLLWYLDQGIIEILDPVGMRVLSRDQLIGGLEGLAEEFGKKLVIPPEHVPYALVSRLAARPPTEKRDPHEDETRTDTDTSALTAAVDQANAKRDGEANSPSSESGGESDTTVGTETSETPETGDSAGEGEDTEVDTMVDTPDPLEVLAEELKGMSRKALDKLASKKYGIKDPKKLANISAVIEAVLEVVSKAEKE